MTISERPLFVYLQRPDNGEWVVAGRYLPDAHAGSSSFRWASSAAYYASCASTGAARNVS